MAENERETRKFKVPTLHMGSWYEKGDEAEMYPFQRRHYVEGGYVEGDVPEEVASDAEKAANALESLKPAHEREDVEPWTPQYSHKEGYGFGEGQSKEEYEESADGSVYSVHQDDEDDK